MISSTLNITLTLDYINLLLINSITGSLHLLQLPSSLNLHVHRKVPTYAIDIALKDACNAH